MPKKPASICSLIWSVLVFCISRNLSMSFGHCPFIVALCFGLNAIPSTIYVESLVWYLEIWPLGNSFDKVMRTGNPMMGLEFLWKETPDLSVSMSVSFPHAPHKETIRMRCLQSRREPHQNPTIPKGLMTIELPASRIKKHVSAL